MAYTNTKQKGDEAELAALIFFKQHQFSVSVPFGENTPYDLIVESPTGTLSRIQVRWCSWNKGTLRLSIRTISKNYCRTLDLSRIDAFLAWDGECAYIVPTVDLEGCTSNVTLRREPPKNNQSKGVRLAKDFLEAVHLLG
jgi:hypothetical protein